MTEPKAVAEEAKTKIIVIEHCLVCPKWGECKPSKKLSKKERLWLTCGVGVPNFTLVDCPLTNQSEILND